MHPKHLPTFLFTPQQGWTEHSLISFFHKNTQYLLQFKWPRVVLYSHQLKLLLKSLYSVCWHLSLFLIPTQRGGGGDPTEPGFSFYLQVCLEGWSTINWDCKGRFKTTVSVQAHLLFVLPLLHWWRFPVGLQWCSAPPTVPPCRINSSFHYVQPGQHVYRHFKVRF